MSQCPNCQRNIGITVKFKSVLLDKGSYCPSCHEKLGVHPFWFLLLAILNLFAFMLMGKHISVIFALSVSIATLLMTIIFLPFVRQKSWWETAGFVLLISIEGFAMVGVIALYIFY